MNSALSTIPAPQDNPTETGQTSSSLIDSAPALVVRVDYPSAEQLETGPLDDLYATVDDSLPDA